MKKIALIIVLLVLSATGCGRKNATAATAAPAVPVKVAPVSLGDIHQVFKTTGIVEANQEGQVSAKIAGRVSQVRVKLGDYVHANQTLILLEQDDLLNQNLQAKAELAQAQANLKQSRDNFVRLQKLYQQQAISKQEFDQAQTTLDIAENKVQQAQAALALNENQLRNTTIAAPFNGYVGLLNVTQGEVVNPGVPLLTVADLSKVLVTVNLSDSYIGRIRKGQKVSIGFTAYPGKQFTGTVHQISPLADETTKTFPVKIILNNPDQKLKAGMLAEVKINFNERKNVLKLPIEAIIDETGNKSVFIVQNNQAVRKRVTLGITDGKMIEIRSGLTGDEQVVVLGQNNLDDGLKVVVK